MSLVGKIAVNAGIVSFDGMQVARLGERFSERGMRWVWEETSQSEVALFRIGGKAGKEAVTRLLKNNFYKLEGGLEKSAHRFARIRKAPPKKG